MAFNKRGADVKTAVLDEAAVLQMRALYAAGGWSVRMLAEHFGISSSAASRTLRGEAWAHLPVGRSPSKEEQQAVRTRRNWEARRKRAP